MKIVFFRLREKIVINLLDILFEPKSESFTETSTIIRTEEGTFFSVQPHKHVVFASRAIDASYANEF